MRIELAKRELTIPEGFGWMLVLLLCTGLLVLSSVLAVIQRNQLRELEARVQQEEQLLAMRLVAKQQVARLQEELQLLEAQANELIELFPKEEEIPVLIRWMEYWLKGTGIELIDFRSGVREDLENYSHTQINVEYITDFSSCVQVVQELFHLFPSLRMEAWQLGIEGVSDGIYSRLTLDLYSVSNKESDWQFPTSDLPKLEVSDPFVPDGRLAAKMSLGQMEERLMSENIRLVGVVIGQDQKYALVETRDKVEMLSEGDYWGELVVHTIGPDYIGLGHIDSEPVIFIQSNNKN